MKKLFTGIVLCEVTFFLFLSCAGIPAADSGATDSPSASDASTALGQSDTPPVPVLTDDVSPPITQAVPNADTIPHGAPSESSVETIPSEPPADATPLAETILPEIAEAGPSLPPGEKLLYFYPEPDPAFTLPVLPSASGISEAPADISVEPPRSETVPSAELTKKSAEIQSDIATVNPEAEKKSEPKTDSAGDTTSGVLPGIWEAEPIAPSIAAVQSAPPVTPSREVKVSVDQILEVWYPGSGWVYLGDASAQNGLSYQTRKLSKGDTLFTFRALKPGNYLLEFTRFDVLEDSFASDALAVTVMDAAGKRSEKIRAPDYRSDTADIASGGTSEAAIETQPAISNALPAEVPSPGISDEPSLETVKNGTSSGKGAESVDTAALLEKARANLASGDATSALAALESFFAAAVQSLDEGLYLQGQAYETNGPSRDIRKALAAYETLVSAYPESSRWSDADARIRYIDQYYLRIR